MALFPIKSHIIPLLTIANGFGGNQGEVNCVSLQHDQQLGYEGAGFRAC